MNDDANTPAAGRVAVCADIEPNPAAPAAITAAIAAPHAVFRA